MQMLLMNPRRRRRKAAARRRHGRRARKMSALQMKYFGKRRGRRSASSAPRRARRRKTIVINANPAPHRRRRRSARRAAARRYRRNPISMPSMGALRGTFASVKKVAGQALVGGAGAVFGDVAMGYLLKALPDTAVAKVGTRYGTDGSPNFMYYGVKLGMVTALGILGSKFAPPKMRGYIAQGTEGALTVGAYEIMRLMLPANIALGAYTSRAMAGANSAHVLPGASAPRPAVGMAAYTGRRLNGLGTNGAGSMVRLAQVNARPSEVRTGEGPIT